MFDINWTLLALAVVIFEVISGGWLTSNLVGGGCAAGGAAWRSASESAKSAYAARRDRLNESAIGRWRLWAEARLGRLAQALGLMTWRFGAATAAVARDGVAAGYRAAPAGAARGREVRQRTIASAKDAAKAAFGLADPPAGVAPLPAPPVAPEPVTAEGPTSSADPAVGAWSDDPWIEGPDREQEQPSAPEVPARGTEEPVSSNTNLGDAVEKVGIVKYLAAWDGEEGGMELVGAALDSLKDRIVTAGEANKHHDPDGVTDIAGKVDAAIQAVLAAGEAIDGHSRALHDKWDSTVEHASGTGADSANELLGSR